MGKSKRRLVVLASIVGGIYYAFRYIKKAYTDGMEELEESMRKIDFD